jgi:predicted membrane protein
MASTARFWWGILLIGLGVLFLLDRAYVLDVRGLIVTFWPLILVFIGIRLLIRRQMGSGRAAAVEENPTGSAERPTNTSTGGNAGGSAGSRTRANTGDRVDESVLFGNANALVVSSTFRGGKVSTIFGGADVDLIGATLAPGTHTLKVDCVFGGVTVRIPADMAVAVAADGVLGEVTVNGVKKEGFFPALEWTSPSYASGSARLQIDASTVFGEVWVVSSV